MSVETEMGQRPPPEWINQLPKYVRSALEPDAVEYLTRFKSLTRRRSSHPDGNRENPSNRYMIWPRSGLHVRLLPGGITPWDELREGSALLEAVRSAMDAGGTRSVAVWGLGWEQHGVYVAKYGSRLCRWVKSQLIFSPSCLMSTSDDLVMIFDEQMNFSIIGGTSKAIQQLDRELGGVHILRSLFERWVKDGGIGFMASDRVWAEKTLLKWCDWT